MQKIIKRYKTLSILLLLFILGIIGYYLGYNNVTNWLFGLSSFLVIVPICYRMIKSIINKNYGLDILAVTAVVSALALGEYLAAMVIIIMLTGGEALEDYAQERAKKELNELLKRAPKIAHIKKGKEYIDVPIASVVVGDILQIKPGEVIPVDSVIIEGSSAVDESALTGESLPIDKKVGDNLLSGSINQQAKIEVTAQKTSQDSQYEQIIQMVSQAASSRSPLVRMADRYSVPFTLIAFILAAFGWIMSGTPQRALEVLVVATPCPLLIATPVALVSGMSRAARHGIIMKNGGALETMSRLKGLIFDKTGTLTKGIPSMQQIIPANNSISKQELLTIAASLETHSMHTLAQAVVSEAKQQNLTIYKVNKIHESVGNGLSAYHQDNKLAVGKYKFLKDLNIKLPPEDTLKSVDGQTAIYIARNGEYIGAISFSDKLRPETINTIKRLKENGIKYMMMLTGDKHSVAIKIANQTGISDVKAECLPSDKLLALKEFQSLHKPVAFIGDGINDAPALAAADVGIALGARGETAASESADVVIMLDDFAKVADSVEISRQTIKIAKQSIFTGIGLSLVLMVFATLTGLIKPIYGALLQEVVDVIVILNALRAHKDS